MPCYRPLTAYRNPNGGPLLFSSRGGYGDRSVKVACGQCMGCRLEYSRVWAMRCTHEASLYDDNCFVTLTYGRDKLPPGNSLWYPDEIGGIILNPQNGEIVALASLPTFNPNNTSDVKDSSVFSNPLVEHVYEMGSIMKPLIIAMGLDSGAITMDYVS